MRSFSGVAVLLVLCSLALLFAVPASCWAAPTVLDYRVVPTVGCRSFGTSGEAAPFWALQGDIHAADDSGLDNIAAVTVWDPAGAPHTNDSAASWSFPGDGTVYIAIGIEWDAPQLGSYTIVVHGWDGTDSAPVVTPPLSHFPEPVPDITHPEPGSVITETDPLFTWPQYPGFACEGDGGVESQWFDVTDETLPWLLWSRSLPTDTTSAQYGVGGDPEPAPPLEPGRTYTAGLWQVGPWLPLSVDPPGEYREEAVRFWEFSIYSPDPESSRAIGHPVPAPSVVRILPDGLTVGGSLIFQDTSETIHILAGRTEIRLPSTAPMLEAEVSPHLDSIAYGIIRGPGWPNRVSVWKSRLDGSAPISLTASAGLTGTNCWPHWSPDGKLIAFQHGEAAPGKQPCDSFHPWVMQADGTGARPVTAQAEEVRGQARWLPDQEHLLTYRPDGSACLVSLDGASLVPLPNVGAFATVSPDGTRIASSRRRSGEVDGKAGWWFELIITGIDGSSPVSVAPQFIPYAVLARSQQGETPYTEEPVGTLTQIPSAWSPGSDKVAFAAALPWSPRGVGAREQMDIWICDLRTGRLWRITDNDVRDWSISWHRWNGITEAAGGPAGSIGPEPFSARTGYLSRAGHVRLVVFQVGRTWLSRADAEKVVAAQQNAHD